MAPAVIQAMWSVSIRTGRGIPEGQGSSDHPDEVAARERRIAGTLNTCHIWAEDGEHVAAIRRGDRTQQASAFSRVLLGARFRHWQCAVEQIVENPGAHGRTRFGTQCEQGIAVEHRNECDRQLRRFARVSQ